MRSSNPDRSLPADLDKANEVRNQVAALERATLELERGRQLLENLAGSNQQLNRLMACLPLVERIERVAPQISAFEASVNLQRLISLLERLEALEGLT